nr:reverse transcriptase domain-containing protein [Tanacetum cinerariifolium]
RFDESFSEAWDRFKDLLKACPHHGFSKLHQLDTFYNALNSKDQDSLNFAAGGNFLDKMPRERLAIIESKSKVCYSRNKPVVAKVSMNTSTSGISPDVAELKDMVKALLLEKSQNQVPATVKAVKETCVTCGGAHSYRNCPATDGNVYRDNIQEFVSQAFAVNYNQGNTSYRPPMMSNQIRPPGFPSVMENETHATKDTVHPTNNESTKDLQPPIVQSKSPILTSEPVNSPIIEPVASPVSAPRPNQRPSIPYPSRLQDQKLRDKANDQREKFFQIFKDLNFNISFVNALILIPEFGPSIKSLLTNKDKLFEVAEDVYVKVGTFHFSADFVVVDFDADPQIPLILRRFFLKTERALIDVFEGELTLRIGKEAITFNLDQTLRYSANYNDMTAKRINVIDMACEEYSQEVMGFSNVITSGNPTSYYDPIVFTTSPTLTPFGNSDFLLEEVDAFLALEDDPTSPEVDQCYLDSEGDILLLEAFLNDDPSLPPLNQGNHLPEVRKELKICEAKSDKSSINEPPEVELKDLPPHLEYAFLKGDDKLPVIIPKDLSVEEKTALITVLKSHKGLKLLDAGLIYPLSDSHWVSPVHCVPKKGGFTVVENGDNELILTHLVTGWRVYIDYRKLNETTRKDHFLLPFMDQMLEKLAGNQYYCFLDGFSGYFQIPIDPKDQEQTTFTCPYRTFAYRRMPFGLCNASGTFQRCMMDIFHDMIEKTMEVFMDDFLVFGNSFQSCVSHLKRMLKRYEDTNLCLNWEKSHFMVKEEAPILIAPDWDMPFELMCDASDFAIDAGLLLQEFTFKVIDTKEDENLAADHLSRLENPHQNVLNPKEIYESFPLETLNLVSTRGNFGTPWFAEFANYHARNFVVKGMSS